VNLPAKQKMADPKYRGIERERIPFLQKDGVKIKVIAGRVDGVEGPVRDLAIDIEYFDVDLTAGSTFEHKTRRNNTVFAYVVVGLIASGNQTMQSGQCAVFDEGESVGISSKGGSRFLFVSGEPLKEPVAWRGPIVMNTEEELDKAFGELEEGTFIKIKKQSALIKN